MKKNIGQRITINGAELYYEYTGETQEQPVIVFESGYGWPLENWETVRNELEDVADLFFYDRACVGKSSKSSGPLHSRQVVRNLRELLQKAGVKPPYLLVGHSFGGVNVRLFAHLYPEETAGVVLLDSCHENQNRQMVPLFTKEVKADYIGQFTVEASLDEFEQSLEQVRGTDLGDMPLLVVTGGNQPYHTEESMEQWLGFQKELAGLSTNSEHITVEGAGHAIHRDDPAIVISLIEKFSNRISGVKEH